MPNSGTRRQLSPVQKALSNELVVRHILSRLKSYEDPYGEVKNLKSCRLVNKLWEKEATCALLRANRNKCIDVPFVWVKSARFTGYRHPTLYSDLEFFNRHIFPCSNFQRQFPCPRFDFGGGPLSSMDIMDFLSKNGRRVQHLSVDFEACEMQLLKTLFLEWVPNLTSLTLCFRSDLRVKSQETVNFPSLPNLRILVLPAYDGFSERRFQDFCPLVVEIVKAARNLKPALNHWPHERVPSSSKIDLYWVRELVAAERLDLIQGLAVTYTSRNLDHLALFCRHHRDLRLVRLSMSMRCGDEFPIGFPSPVLTRLSTVVNLLLSVSADSLEELNGLGQVIQVLGPNVHVPVMAKLRRFTVNDNYQDSTRILPTDRYKIHQVFPSLKCLYLYNNHRGSSEDRGNIFIEPNSSSTLEKLALSSSYMKCDDDYKNYDQLTKFAKMGAMYPNLTILYLGICMDPLGQNFRLLCQMIWTFQWNLTELRFDCKFPGSAQDVTVSPDFSAERDAAVTGVDVETCRQVASQFLLLTDADKWDPYEFEQDYVNVKNKQLGPSIKNLKSLRQFCVRMVERPNNLEFFSCFSTFYAFNPMNLCVIVEDYLPRKVPRPLPEFIF